MVVKFAFCLAGVAAVYHHAGYPMLLRLLASKRNETGLVAAPPGTWPSVEMIVPAFNEARFIAGKIVNIAALDYPGDLVATIVCDGCTDDTAALARQAAALVATRVRVVEHNQNRGKIAILNEAIGQSQTDLIALSDVSAHVPPDAVAKAAVCFQQADVAFVSGRYEPSEAATDAEKRYWRYQSALKAAEARLGAPFGAHGAFYVLRRSLIKPLAPCTINDDVVLPMQAVAEGHRGVYRDDIPVREMETDRVQDEFRRRMRLGAGNVQQAIRLWRLANPRRPGLAFVFLSGKALRAFMPFVLVAGFVAAAALAASGTLPFIVLTALAIPLCLLCLVPERFLPWPLALMTKVTRGYAAAFLGAVAYLVQGQKSGWRRAARMGGEIDTATFVPVTVAASKRALDFICGLAAFAALAVLYVPIAIGIKATSRGPIFYRQLRVGRLTPTCTELFWLIKFRTMRQDAEVKSGPVWASANDPRITGLGRFLRKSRLDELPQCINVLRGEMSVVGPRPERPAFFRKLENEIPFYTERTFGLKPGITGLAQINQAYDQTIEDVRNKVLFDHAYAVRLYRWRNWLLADIAIILKTATVMVSGKGAR